MKPWWLLAFVACSGERDTAREASGSQRPNESRRSIDVRVTGAPISIRGVEIARSATSPGVLELGYRVEAKDPTLSVPARVMCLVGGYTIVYPASNEGKPPGPRLATLFRPDPFSEPAKVCEAAFFVLGGQSESGPLHSRLGGQSESGLLHSRLGGQSESGLLHSRAERQVAAACYRDGELVDGACPAGTFPPPPRTTTFGVELARAVLELREGTALVSGLYTLAEPLAAGRRFAAQIRCEDTAGVATGEGEFAFLPLESIPVGASVYGPVAIFLDRTPEKSATCDLRIVSRALAGSPTEHIHAHYCMTTGAIRAGDCEK